MQQIILSFLFLLASFVSYTQNRLQLLDQVTQKPIYNAMVYTELYKITVLSDSLGYVDITAFSSSSRIYIRHISYKQVVTSLDKIKRQDFVLELKPKAQNLKEVVLSASKSQQKRDRVAEQIAVITALDIARLQPQTSADLLDNTPGVRVQKSQAGGGSPVLRGLEANRVLLVVDGVPMNNAIYRSGHLQNSITVHPTTLERVEVLFGPSSVLYGSDALGGVVHFYTKSANIGAAKGVDTQLLSSYNSANQSIINSISTGVSLKKWGVYTGLTYSRFGDIKMGSYRPHGFSNWAKVRQYSNNTQTYYNPNPVENTDLDIQKNTGYSQLDFLQKWSYKPCLDTKFNFNIQYSTSSDIPRFDKLTEYQDGALRFAQWYYGPQKRLLLSPQIEIAPNTSWLTSGVVTLAYQDIRESRISRAFSSITKQWQKEKVQVYSLHADFLLELDKKQEFTYGLALTHNRVASKAYSKDLIINGNQILGYTNYQNIPTRYPSAGSTYSTFALYADHRRDITKRSTLNIGARYTYTALQAAWQSDALINANLSNVHTDNSSLTATIGYVYRLKDHWQIKGVVSSGFRSPNIDDIGKIREKRGVLTVPNPEVRPEYAYSSELGFAYFSKNKRHTISLDGFYTLLNNAIGRSAYTITSDTTTSNPNTILYGTQQVATYSNVNLGTAYITGATLTSSLGVFPGFTLQHHITLTKGRSFVTDGALPSISPVFGGASMAYTKGRFKSLLSMRYSGSKHGQDFVSTGEDALEETPVIGYDAMQNPIYHGSVSWWVLDAYFGMDVSRAFSFSVSLENILDLHYKPFASGVSGMGRNFKTTFTYRF